MRGDVEDLEWAAHFIAGLGVPFVIHHPAELRTVLQQYALTLAELCQTRTSRSPASSDKNNGNHS